MHVTCKIIYVSTRVYIILYIHVYSCLLFFVDFSVSVKGHTKLCSSSRESEVSYFCARLRMNTCMYMYIACSRCIIMYVIYHCTSLHCRLFGVVCRTASSLGEPDKVKYICHVMESERSGAQVRQRCLRQPPHSVL